MSGFSNSLGYLIYYGIHVIRIRYSNSYIQQLHKSLTICLIIRSSVLEYHSLPAIFAILQQLMMDRLPKKFAQPIHPSTATALHPPSNLQWTQIRDFQTRTRNPGLTFPKPKNPGLQKELWFGNSKSDYGGKDLWNRWVFKSGVKFFSTSNDTYVMAMYVQQQLGLFLLSFQLVFVMLG